MAVVIVLCFDQSFLASWNFVSLETAALPVYSSLEPQMGDLGKASIQVQMGKTGETWSSDVSQAVEQGSV